MNHIEVFKGADGRYWFHLVSGNNRITASSQGYRRRWNAKRAARKLWPDLQVVVK